MKLVGPSPETWLVQPRTSPDAIVVNPELLIRVHLRIIEIWTVDPSRNFV